MKRDPWDFVPKSHEAPAPRRRAAATTNVQVEFILSEPCGCLSADVIAALLLKAKPMFGIAKHWAFNASAVTGSDEDTAKNLLRAFMDFEKHQGKSVIVLIPDVFVRSLFEDATDLAGLSIQFACTLTAFRKAIHEAVQ